MPDLQLPPNIPKHRRPLSFGDHQTGDRIELRPQLADIFTGEFRIRAKRFLIHNPAQTKLVQRAH